MAILVATARRTCTICGRKEAAASLHLTAVYEDGRMTRACDQCRDQLSWYCQSRQCRKEQIGHQYFVEGFAMCASCVALDDSVPQAS